MLGLRWNGACRMVDLDECPRCIGIGSLFSDDTIEYLGVCPECTGDGVVVAEHRTRVFLTYTAFGTPYKWSGECLSCTWQCFSWAWQREDGSGTYAMALEHARTGGL